MDAQGLHDLAQGGLHVVRLVGDHRQAQDGEQVPGSLYGKVLSPVPGMSTGVFIRFTSVPPEIDVFLRPMTG